MARILILIILGFILVQILKRMAASADAKPTNNVSAKAEEKMIQCSNCGCHVPLSESLIKNNKVICNNSECQR